MQDLVLGEVGPRALRVEIRDGRLIHLSWNEGGPIAETTLVFLDGHPAIFDFRPAGVNGFTNRRFKALMTHWRTFLNAVKGARPHAD
jgi:hypothetical protein